MLMRAAFILAGAALIARFHWTIYVFGAFLVLTGVKILFADEQQVHPEANPLLRLARRLLPVTSDFHVECSLPGPDAWARFAAALERKGKGRLCLEAKIYCRDVACANYTGAFAAIILPNRRT